MSNPDKNPLFNYARYSAVAIQMLVIIAAGVFGGFKLDQWLHTKPLFTILLSLSGVALAIYYTVRDLIKKREK